MKKIFDGSMRRSMMGSILSYMIVLAVSGIPMSSGATWWDSWNGRLIKNCILGVAAVSQVKAVDLGQKDQVLEPGIVENVLNENSVILTDRAIHFYESLGIPSNCSPSNHTGVCALNGVCSAAKIEPALAPIADVYGYSLCKSQAAEINPLQQFDSYAASGPSLCAKMLKYCIAMIKNTEILLDDKLIIQGGVEGKTCAIYPVKPELRNCEQVSVMLNHKPVDRA